MGIEKKRKEIYVLARLREKEEEELIFSMRIAMVSGEILHESCHDNTKVLFRRRFTTYDCNEHL